MGLSARLVMRQGQALVMTPQLLQAIKLLQLSNVELASFIEEQLEANPLLERADSGEDAREATAEGKEDFDDVSSDYGPDAGAETPGEGDWASETLSHDPGELAQSLGTGVENAFDADRDLSAKPAEAASDAADLSGEAWSGSAGASAGTGSAGGEEAPNLEAYIADRLTLHEHLARQLGIALADPVDRLIGAALIDAIDDTGYCTADCEALAARLGVAIRRVERVLSTIQTFEPVGVGARSLAECLAIQLADRDRYDPAMQALVANLPLLARRDFAALRKICGVDEEDMADMAAELRRLDPKPGRSFGGAEVQAVAPDVIVRAAPDGSWLIELNSDALPRVLVNQTYAARVSGARAKEEDKAYISNCLQTANWLTKSLEQRAKTILKVSSEIVRQQDAFFMQGVEHLRPLNLKTVADLIGMHESTVSRVTSNKFMMTPRGLFELKYFFTTSIASSLGGEAHSAEAVRFKIRQMIEAEDARDVLSDDSIVMRLKEADIDIARRTVAKYRESLRIPSSVERRREKLMRMAG